MEKFIHHTTCPVCNSNNLKQVLIVKDYTVSGENFPVLECTNCTLRFTQDTPAADFIGPYYKSEDYISHTDTSKGFINKLYRSVRKRTLRNKYKLVENASGIKGGYLLDIGAGTGAFVNEMRSHGWNVTGLEPDEGARNVAQRAYNLKLDPITEFYNLKEESYDVITLWHVLEHVHDLHLYIEQLKKLLKHSGTLFIAVPNYTSKDATIYREYWAAYDVPRHLYHFSPKSMSVLSKKHGLIIQSYKPMWYDSYYISMLSSKYKNGKTNLVASFFNGLGSNLKTVGDVKKCSSIIYIIKKLT